MGTEHASGGVSLGELEYVIDADAHLRENITDIAPYLDDGVRKFVDRSSNPSFGLFSTSKATPSRFEYGAIYGFEPDEEEHYSLENKIEEFEDFDLDYALTLTNLLSLNTANNDQIARSLMISGNNGGNNRWVNFSETSSSVIISKIRPVCPPMIRSVPSVSYTIRRVVTRRVSGGTSNYRYPIQIAASAT